MNIVGKEDKRIFNERSYNLFDKIVWLARQDLQLEKVAIDFYLNTDNVLDDDSLAEVHYFPHNKIKYKIFIREELSKTEFVKKILHEIVHVSQFESGLLSRGDNGAYKWRGKEYTRNFYLNFPWEKEARKIELLSGDYVARARKI